MKKDGFGKTKWESQRGTRMGKDDGRKGLKMMVTILMPMPIFMLMQNNDVVRRR